MLNWSIILVLLPSSNQYEEKNIKLKLLNDIDESLLGEKVEIIPSSSLSLSSSTSKFNK